jgi:hypothetical protein
MENLNQTTTKTGQNMKKLFVIAAVVSLIAVAKLGATTVTIDRVNGYYSGTGGEFNISQVLGGGYAASVLVNNNSGNLGFETFCIEETEQVSIPGTYNAVRNPYGDALNGGVNLGAAGPDGGDPISIGTAYLYYNFAKGILAGYNYTPGAGRIASAGNLQTAIWYLENEITLTPAQVLANSYLTLVSGLYGSSGEFANANGAFGVGALNNYYPSGSRAQDMLVLPDGGFTVMLLGMALGGFGLLARRIRA